MRQKPWGPMSGRQKSVHTSDVAADKATTSLSLSLSLFLSLSL